MISDTITLHRPAVTAFGRGCWRSFAGHFANTGRRRLCILASPSVTDLAGELAREVEAHGRSAVTVGLASGEPTLGAFDRALDTVRDTEADAVAGVGGGSALDLAKLVAAMLHSDRSVHDVLGVDRLEPRRSYLACFATTAGTGSEVSPNAIFLDEADNQKKAAISGQLVPDSAYVDPEWTRCVPPHMTATTGLDALAHCIEAFANRFAHPVVDLYALEGIRLISRSLERAFRDGNDMAARSDVALGSLYGGMCLGPVNTAAAHALAYPLGGPFHVPHGLSVALLLPHVMEFNVPAAPDRYAAIATALGAPRQATDTDTALAGVRRLQEICRHCQVPARLFDVGISAGMVPALATEALKVTRLLDRNVRNVTLADAESIYLKAL